MDATTTDRYRVLSIDEAASTARLVELAAATAAVDAPDDAPPEPFAPIAVSLDDAAIDPGNVIEATIEWSGDDASIAEASVLRADRYYYARGVSGLFQVAIDTWQTARAAGDRVGASVTRNTDGDPNGVCYVFADQPEGRPIGAIESGGRTIEATETGGRTVEATESGGRTFEAIESGSVPIEPLVLRAEADLNDDRNRAAFVLEPAARPFVVVYVVFDDEGLLARTVRETYGIDR
ncbi:MAG: DUF6663 family protein [Halobacteriota archaeon]